MIRYFFAVASTILIVVAPLAAQDLNAPARIDDGLEVARPALQDAGKPVEMHVFPEEHHQKWRPVHRLNIYRRNVQWFEFWLMGREDPEPVDRGAVRAVASAAGAARGAWRGGLHSARSIAVLRTSRMLATFHPQGVRGRWPTLRGSWPTLNTTYPGRAV
jgi:hypothetical protein